MGSEESAWIATLKQYRAIAIIRAPDVGTGLAMARAVIAGGFRLIEVTWNSDRPAELLHRLRQAYAPGCTIGAGTVLTRGAMNDAIAAGAQFCVSPHTDVALINLARAHDIPVIPGALTPTEIASAWQQGASSIKVFPALSLGGPAYIQHLQAPLGHIPLIPTGGVTVENGADFLAAGAIAIGLSSSLFPKSLLVNQDWPAIEVRAHRLSVTLKNKGII